MSTAAATVLCHLPDGYLQLGELAHRFPDWDFVQVPTDGPIPKGITGEVALTVAAPSGNLVELLARGVRWVHCTGHGVDHLPLEEFSDQLVTCSRGVSADAIAEWVVAMILAWAKRLPESWVDEPPERWFMSRLDGLGDSTVTLIGLGSINTAVAERLAPFGCRILAVRRTARPCPVPAVEVMDTITEAVASADHIVLAAPLTPATHHLIDTECFAATKPGVHLVNVARGALIDQEALREALDDDRVGRASLDVAEPEPLPAGHWLYQHPRVLLSPHVSWVGPGYLRRVTAMFGDYLERWIAGRSLDGIVDLEAGY
ncbi:MAG: NAD(P)-dependent oxidoreductase [Actinomycetota bacterium]|nr:NAD(P)-dependent oxidoreductase [Actinomycetota bacterium]